MVEKSQCFELEFRSGVGAAGCPVEGVSAAPQRPGHPIGAYPILHLLYRPTPRSIFLSKQTSQWGKSRLPSSAFGVLWIKILTGDVKRRFTLKIRLKMK